MRLSEACRFSRDLTDVSVAPLPDTEDMITFCERHRFHPAQKYLLPHALKRLFASLSPAEILVALDPFHVRFVFFLVEDTPVAIGPFCTEFFSQNDCAILLRQRGFSLPPQDLLAWRGAIPVRPESEMLHLARTLISNLGSDRNQRTIRRVGFDMEIVAINDAAIHKTYVQLVRERYRIEAEFMDNIRQGNSIAAIDNWRRLHSSVAYMKSLGHPLESARISAAITRTTIRVAAMEAGLPAVLNDQISGQSTRNIDTATSIDAIDQEHVRLIREYCRAIHAQKDSGHSNLVLSAVYHMERHYAERITVAGMAAELEVAPNYLTARFSKEKGISPGAYLLDTRLRHASVLLASSDLPVQDVSERVGIPDANYFAKLFRRKYGETPVQYRRHHRI